MSSSRFSVKRCFKSELLKSVQVCGWNWFVQARSWTLLFISKMHHRVVRNLQRRRFFFFSNQTVVEYQIRLINNMHLSCKNVTAYITIELFMFLLSASVTLKRGSINTLILALTRKCNNIFVVHGVQTTKLQYNGSVCLSLTKISKVYVYDSTYIVCYYKQLIPRGSFSFFVHSYIMILFDEIDYIPTYSVSEVLLT